MLLAIVLLFFTSESAVKGLTTHLPPHLTPWNAMTTEAAFSAPPSTFAETLSPPVVAKPLYPIVAGPTVDLRCTALAAPASVIWSWQRLEDRAWREVGRGNSLTLAEPGQSGLYRCSADTALSHSVSNNITVFILAMHPTVGEKLGIAALVLSLLAMTVALTILFLIVWPRFGGPLTASDSAAKASPGPGKAPKGGSPQAESDGDVYMNYTNEAYSDLDPSSMTGDNLYSSLS